MRRQNLPGALMGLCLLLGVPFLLGAPLLAQGWAGQGRVSGVVLDDDEQPLAAAEIRLQRGEDGPEPVTTDAEGRWSHLGLASGRWRIVIAAEGFIQADGWVDAVAGPSDPVRVVLRPITEVMPLGAEHPRAVYGWLEKGNSLLEQGQAAAARAEYVRALRVLPLDQKPEILRAVARTYYLESDAVAAIASLQLALVAVPSDPESRGLYQALLDGLGRGGEASAWLARLDAEGGESVAPEIEQPADLAALNRGPSAAPPPDDRPILQPEAHRKGAYRLRLAERAALSSLDVYLERFGKERAEIVAIDPAAAAYDLAEESFEVIVPESYTAEEDGAPWGLFVWVSPTPTGRLQRPENLAMLEERRMLWIGANNSGNRRKVWDRVGLALDAASAMAQLYRIDPRRVYAAGYSGGGRMATGLSVLYPEVFTGGFLVYGCDFYRDVPIPFKPGAYWPAAFPLPPKERLRLAKERNRYVFFTGENDFNRAQTKIFSKLYTADGFRHVNYMEIPGADHYTGFDGKTFGQVIDALDAGLSP